MYHNDIYNFNDLPKSYWFAQDNNYGEFLDLETISQNEEFDVLIVGAGYTGLSCAINLSDKYNLKICIVDAGIIGWGASTRNAGFCCIPPTKLTINQLMKRYGKEETISFFKNCIEGTNYTKSLIDKYNISCDISGNQNYVLAHTESKFDKLIKESEIYDKLFGIETEIFNKEQFNKIGHSGKEQFGALSYKPGFALNPLKFYLGLLKAAIKNKVNIFHKTKIISVTKKSNFYIAKANNKKIKTKKIVIATNGFYQDGLIKQIDSRILPIISNIIVTNPLSNKELSLHNFKTYSPIVNTRNLLYYYRKLPDNRILFGARGDTDGSDKSHKAISKIIERDFKYIFPEWGNIKIDFTWRGLVAFTSKLAPSIGKIKDENIFYSFGYHANGVSSAPWSGMQLSKIIYGSNFGNMNISKVYKGLPKKIPVSSLRKIYLKFVYFAYQIKDYFKL